jgi:AraC-like DNA-binding protein
MGETAPQVVPRVVRGRAEGGSWELIFGSPHPALSSYVREYCGYRERTAGPIRRREMPAAQVVMIIDFGPTLRILDQIGQAPMTSHPGGFLAGIDDGFTLTETVGAMEGIQVNFTPIGARLLVGRPMHELVRHVISLPDALGEGGRHLSEQLYEAPGWAARFRQLDRFILERVRTAEALPGWVPAAWDRIERSGGAIDVARLVREIGYSRKHLAAVFREQVGMPPKAIARLVRFQRALEALRAGGDTDLAQLALDLGYYDQAHFGREFRGFAGMSPGECRRMWRPGSLGLPG